MPYISYVSMKKKEIKENQRAIPEPDRGADREVMGRVVRSLDFISSELRATGEL